MKRELTIAILGAALLVPSSAEAQRNRNRNPDRDRVERGEPTRDRNGDRDRAERIEPTRDRGATRGPVERLEPIRATGRVSPFGVSGRRTIDYRRRVIYSNRGRSRAVRGRGVWVRANWGHVYMEPYGLNGRRRELSRSDLRDILGRRTVDRVRNVGRSLGLRGGIRGHWVRGAGFGRVLVVTMGRVDIAEFVDFDRDGFVDDVFLIGSGQRGRRLTFGR